MRLDNVRAVFRNGAFKPKLKLNLPPGTEVILSIEIPAEAPPAEGKPRSISEFRGILSDVKEDSVTLQHKVKEWLAEKYDR